MTLDLHLDNHIQARAEFKDQLRRLCWDSYLKHDLASDEQGAIFREIIGEIEEVDDTEAFYNE